MAIETVSFDPSHINALQDHPLQKMLDGGNWDQLMGVTILQEDEILGIIGLSLIHTGVYDAVFVPSAGFYKHTKSCYRLVKTWLEGAQNVVNWHRIQATARIDAPHHIRFLAHLGFSYEGVLRRYAPDGTDLLMYSMVRGE